MLAYSNGVGGVPHKDQYIIKHVECSVCVCERDSLYAKGLCLQSKHTGLSVYLCCL